MNSINLNFDNFNAGLDVFHKGFTSESDGNYQEFESNIPSILNMLETLQKIDTTIRAYHNFLQSDVVKFRQVGESIREKDVTISRKMGGTE